MTYLDPRLMMLSKWSQSKTPNLSN